jgi:hypothetical protein
MNKFIEVAYANENKPYKGMINTSWLFDISPTVEFGAKTKIRSAPINTYDPTFEVVSSMESSRFTMFLRPVMNAYASSVVLTMPLLNSHFRKRRSLRLCGFERESYTLASIR